MGWTGIYDSRPTKVILTEEMTWSSENGSSRVLELRTKRNVSYLAVERTYNKTVDLDGRPGPHTFVIGVVVLHGRRNGEFTYKVISEDMGPYEHECPASVLDRLSPVEDFTEANSSSREYAIKWRAQAREAIRRKKNAPGDRAVIRFATPIKFTDGSVEDTFTIRKSGRKTRFLVDNPYRVFMITNWQQRDYEILENAPNFA